MIFVGLVEKGLGEAGRVYNLPTANLKIDTSQIRPGIYAGLVHFKSEIFQAVICLGLKPNKLEAHLLNFTGNLYGQEIRIELLSLVGGLTDFISTKQMGEKIAQDVLLVKQYFASLN